MWEITPLFVGAVTAASGGLVLKHGLKANASEPVDTPHIAWYLEDTSLQKKVLIDTGSGLDVEHNSRNHNPVRRTPGEHIVGALQKHGIIPESLDLIILTHLHWDHAQGVLDLPKTIPVLVQKKELQFAVAPFPTDAKHYEVNLKEDIPYFLKFFNQIQLVDGDKIILPGLKVIQLPGHSPGSQGVVVDTAKGRYIIPGDLVNVKENWEKRVPSGIYNDMAAYFNSFDKLAEYETNGAVIVPVHDYTAFEIF